MVSAAEIVSDVVIDAHQFADSFSSMYSRDSNTAIKYSLLSLESKDSEQRERAKLVSRALKSMMDQKKEKGVYGQGSQVPPL
jgi:hypothetical protein